MSILELLFGRRLIKLKENMVKLDDVLFEPIKSKSQHLEHTPISMKFELIKFKHIYTGRLNIEWEEYTLPYCKGIHTYKNKTIEVKSIYKNKCNIVAIANKLYRNAVKTFIKQNRPKGFKSCLLEYYEIEEGNLQDFRFYLNRTNYMLSTSISKKKKK